MQASPARPPAIPIAAPEGSLPATLAALLDMLWQRLADGVRDRWTPWGLPALLSTAGNGAPQGRIVALREFDPARRMFLFHTDARSDKVEQFSARGQAGLLFWDPRDAVEVRIDGRVLLHRGDALARVAWRDASPISKSAAAGLLAPGTQLYASTPFPELPGTDDDAQARSNFALIVFEAHAIDWLWIGRGDLRRARFGWTGADWAGTWVVP
jgi:pyridoxamine 5'-phosphate oxidase